MLLKSRNRILTACFFLSLFLLVLTVILFLNSHTLNQILQTSVNYQKGLFSTFFFRSSYIAVIFSIAVITLYVPISFIFLYLNFEKTQSSEVIFFITFLLGCLTECMRIINIIYLFQSASSTMLIFINKLIFFGRLLCPLSMLCSTVMSNSEQRQDLERNFIIMIAVAAFFAFLIPINIVNLSYKNMIPWGFSKLFNILYLLFSIAAVISFYIEAKKQESQERLRMLLGFILLITGYYFLILFNNLFSLFFGSILLISGTYIYLKNIHLLYLWN